MKKKLICAIFLSLMAGFQQSYTQTFVVPKRFVWEQIPKSHDRRPGSYPWICGDTFRVFCDHIIDETLIPFDPQLVEPADTIFVNLKYIDFFLYKIHYFE